MRGIVVALVLAPVVAMAATPAAEPAEWVRSNGLGLVRVASRLESPVYLTAPAGDPRLFVVEQPGRIRIIRNGTLLATPFLDIADRVGYGGERGLLGLAFHPRYASNGLFYVNYTNRSGDTRVERYHVKPDAPDVADRASAQLVLAIDQPYANHNGGHLLFDPDGMLLIPTGDGGSGGDPQRRAQNPQDLLGKLLRIDVDAAVPYRSVRSAAPGTPRAEIWATGLRNPWRIALDPATRLLYIADVGQSTLEEINVAPLDRPLLNFGWNIMEGTDCFRDNPCKRTGLTLPVVEYPHSEGCSITGGVVYRGRTVPALQGHYLFSDYCSGWLRSFRWADGRAVDRREWNVGRMKSVTSFGADAAGEVYVLSQSGDVFRLAATR